MEERRFGEVGRWLRAVVDRRAILRSLPVALGGTGLGFGPVPSKAGKKQRKRKKRCRKKENRTLCGRQCVVGSCCPGKTCGAGNCLCLEAVENDTFCARDELVECGVILCATSSECGPGKRCIPGFDVGETCCISECDAV